MIKKNQPSVDAFIAPFRLMNQFKGMNPTTQKRQILKAIQSIPSLKEALKKYLKPKRKSKKKGKQ